MEDLQQARHSQSGHVLLDASAQLLGETICCGLQDLPLQGAEALVIVPGIRLLVPFMAIRCCARMAVGCLLLGIISLWPCTMAVLGLRLGRFMLGHSVLGHCEGRPWRVLQHNSVLQDMRWRLLAAVRVSRMRAIELMCANAEAFSTQDAGSSIMHENGGARRRSIAMQVAWWHLSWRVSR